MTQRRLWFVLACCIGSLSLIETESVGFAAEKAESAKQESKLKPFPIPEGDAGELFEFIEGIAKAEHEFSSEEEERIHQQRTMLTMIAVGDRLLSRKDLEDDDSEKAAFLKVQGYLNLAILADFRPKATQQVIAAVDQLAKDPRPAVSKFAKHNRFIVRMICVAGLSPKERDALIDDVIAEVQAQGFSPAAMDLAQAMGNKFSSIGDEERQIAFSEKLAAALKGSGEEELVELSKHIEGQLRQMQLVGKTLELEGTTLTGEKFDWKAYKGKVVLVDFWATYCGPCRDEIPNILRNYRQYHDKGFEVVGINVDTDAEKVSEFVKDMDIPWVNLVEMDETRRGMAHPMAVYYGVSLLPTTILVDQEGKVVSLMVRGPELSRRLKELLGDKE